MTELFVLHIESYYPEDEYFEDTQYINDSEKPCIVTGYNLSIIIFYNYVASNDAQSKFTLLTDNITFIKENDDNYTATHKYNHFALKDISSINLLISRMSGGDDWIENLRGICGKYNLHKLQLCDFQKHEYTTFDKVKQKLTDSNRIAFLDVYRLNKNTINGELELIKALPCIS